MDPCTNPLAGLNALSDEFCTAGTYSQMESRGWHWAPDGSCNTSISGGALSLLLDGSYTSACGYQETSTDADFGIAVRVHLRQRTSDTRPPATENAPMAGISIRNSADAEMGLLMFGAAPNTTAWGVMLNPYSADGTMLQMPNDDTVELLACFIQGRLFFGGKTPASGWSDVSAAGSTHPMTFFGRLSLNIETETYPRNLRADFDYVRIWSIPSGTASFPGCAATVPHW